MDRSPWKGRLLGLTLLVSCSGCLVVHNATNVIRENEPRRPMAFESDEARQAFDTRVAALRDRKSEGKSRVIAIPFLLLYSRSDVLSDNAFYNDQLAECDSNGDGIVTLAEASAYSAKPQENASSLADLSRDGKTVARTGFVERTIDPPRSENARR